MPATPEHLYEQMLVVRAQIGDDAAFEELLRLDGPRLLQFAGRMLQSSPELVPDLIQEIWVAIFRGLPALLDPAKFRPWAFRIARDRIYRTYRKRRLPLLPLDDAMRDELPLAEETSDIDRDALELGLETLSPEHREALRLRFFEDMTYEEISRTTGSSIGTVRSRIFYGKQALKAALEKQQL